MKPSELFHKCAYDIEYDTAGDSVNYKLVEEGSTLYIYFQGSHEAVDWFENFNFWPIAKTVFKNIFRRHKKAFDDTDIKYHRGFLECWNQVKPIIIKKVQTKTTTSNLTRDSEFKWKYKYKSIVIVGYSHGAALAGLCYESVQFFRPDLLKGVTLQGHCFEAPRWLYHGKKHYSRWDGCLVYRNYTDLVTHVPPRLFGFRDPCKIIHIGTGKKHPDYKFPKCIGAHYPDKVYESLLEYEKEQEDKETK